MPRPADPAKRADLLHRIRGYVLRNGLTSLSLRPLARELGTSDRMLLYYFGTKERMVAEALSLDDRRPLLRFRDVRNSTDAPENAAGLRRLLEELWEEFHSPDRRAAMPLQFELMTASVLHPDKYGPLMLDLITEWTDLYAPFSSASACPTKVPGTRPPCWSTPPSGCSTGRSPTATGTGRRPPSAPFSTALNPAGHPTARKPTPPPHVVTGRRVRRCVYADGPSTQAKASWDLTRCRSGRVASIGGAGGRRSSVLPRRPPFHSPTPAGKGKADSGYQRGNGQLHCQ